MTKENIDKRIRRYKNNLRFPTTYGKHLKRPGGASPKKRRENAS
jgi:hypothetical protein